MGPGDLPRSESAPADPDLAVAPTVASVPVLLPDRSGDGAGLLDRCLGSGEEGAPALVLPLAFSAVEEADGAPATVGPSFTVWPAPLDFAAPAVEAGGGPAILLCSQRLLTDTVGGVGWGVAPVVPFALA